MISVESITGESVVSKSPLSGGCIGNSFRVDTKSRSFFLKSYSRPGISQAEAHGLSELKKATEVLTPEVIASTENELLLEFIKSRAPRRDFQSLLGNQLATLHRVKGENFGFYENNFIGESHQINQKRDSWNEFYVENRISYQLNLAKRNGYFDAKLENLSNKLLALIPEILAGSEEEPALLHGDLWGGNVMTNETGEPVLIDPAVYYGHRESDIAMTMLFGGFDQQFYESYNRHYPLAKGWESRLDLYKLYHILNHLNLFGESYYSQVISLIKAYL